MLPPERDQLSRLLATARQVAESLDLDTVLTSIVEDATTLLGADSGDILLLDRDADVLRVVAVANFEPDMLGFELPFGDGVSSQAIFAQRTIQVDTYGTYEHRARALDRYDFGAVLCAPLIFRGEAIGTINVHARADQRSFPADAADLLGAFAAHAAIAIDHARRFENEVRLGRDLATSNQDLSRSLAVQQRLAEAVLAGTGPAGIATVLAEHLDREVVIQDHLRRSIAGAQPGGGEGWRRLVDEAAGSQAPIKAAIRMGAEVVGFLVLSSDDELGPTDRALVDVATTGVALEFAKARAAAEVEERLRGEAVTDLLTGSYADEATIAARAARLGYDLAEPREVLVIHRTRRAEDGGDGADDEAPVLALVRDRLSARAPRSLAVAHVDAVVVLAGVRGRPAGDTRALAEDLRASLESTLGIGTITVAVGERCLRPDDYGVAYRAARDALDLMLRLGRHGLVVGAAELGSYALLLRVSSRDDLEAFAGRTLQPLVEHDAARGGDLLTTLRMYLEEDRSQRRVATRAFIHVNTVAYRIRRIEELLKMDLDDPATVFDLTLALRIRDLGGVGARLTA
jgi:sugar diacid utilization regulator